MYCNILVTKPLNGTFTYKTRVNQKVKIGNIVSVPFGKKNDQLGLVIELIGDKLTLKVLPVEGRR